MTELLFDDIENGIMEYKMMHGYSFFFTLDVDDKEQMVNCYDLSLFLDKYIRKRYDVVKKKGVDNPDAFYE